jgi:hypothetical protein
MEIQQMELLLARMNASIKYTCNQAKLMAEWKAHQGKREAERKVDQEVATRLEAIHDKIGANQMRAEPETKTNQGNTEATDLKGNPEEMECESEHREVPKEDATRKQVKGWKTVLFNIEMCPFISSV